MKPSLQYQHGAPDEHDFTFKLPAEFLLKLTYVCMLFNLEMACTVGSANQSRINNTLKQTNYAETNAIRV